MTSFLEPEDYVSNSTGHPEYRAKMNQPLHFLNSPRPLGDRRRSPSRRNRRGTVMLEFSLAFLPLLAVIFAQFDFLYSVFARAALHHAVREGVRYAITADTKPGLAHDDSIKAVVKGNALGLLTTPAAQEKIKIRYYLRRNPPRGRAGITRSSPVPRASTAAATTENTWSSPSPRLGIRCFLRFHLRSRSTALRASPLPAWRTRPTFAT